LIISLLKIKKELLLILCLIIQNDNMKKINILIFLLVCIIFLVVPVSSQLGSNPVSDSQMPSLNGPIPGSTVSVAGNRDTLKDFALDLMDFLNTILRALGQKEIVWAFDPPSPVQVATVSQAQGPVTAAPSAFESADLDTVMKITGGPGTQSVNVTVPPAGYWEIWYTVDPMITGGQDVHSATGSYSGVFPTFSIVISDLKTGVKTETIEPPGGLDITLWQRAGDPRPWKQRFYNGDKEFNFLISGSRIHSYVIEIKVPKTRIRF
jgi:hypothetical protein